MSDVFSFSFFQMRLNFNINLLKNKIDFLVLIYDNLVIHEKTISIK